jgi:anti-sigma factor RsiW
MSGCLGDVAAALVDGELDHAARERAQRHLAHCDTCRAEVDAHRSLKARLARLSTEAPEPGTALTDRLLALSRAGAAGTDRVPAALNGPVRPVTLRAPAGPGGVRPRRRAVRRRTTVGSALLGLGAVAVALGGAQTAATTPVDPATDSFVVQHVDTTSEAPRVVRAGLTGGAAGTAR